MLLDRITIGKIALWTIAWTLVSLVIVRIEVADAARAGFEGRIWEPWVWAFSAGFAYAGLSPVIVYFCKKWSLDAGNIPPTLFKLIVLYVPMALLFTTLMLGLRHLAYFLILGESYPIDNVLDRYIYEFPRSFILYFSVVFVTYAYLYQEKANEQRVLALKLDSELKEARLQALQDQLQPHFLFNTLNLISNRMYKTPDVADKIMSNLGSLLRYSLRTTDFTALQDELDAMQEFVEIVRHRFGERFSYRQEIADSCAQIRVPSMLLQPLLENAVKHGVEPSASGGDIVVGAEISGEILEIQRPTARHPTYRSASVLRT